LTRAPTQAWTAQQLRNATPFGQGPQFLIRDRDDKFGKAFDRVASGAGVRVLRTAVRGPLMNSVCERFLGSVRRECLDHIVILSEPHLRPRRIRSELLQHGSAAPGDRAADSGSIRARPSLVRRLRHGHPLCSEDFTMTTAPRR